jgi:LEA14-like dessication related protein
MTKRFFPILLFPVFILGFWSCNSIADPEFRAIENIRVGKVGMEESILNVDILYTNPNKTRLKLRKAEGEAWIDNNYLGHFTMDTLIAIPSRGDFVLPVKLQIDMKKILTNSLVAFLANEVTVKVEGKARVGKGFLYINYPIRYEGKQNLRELIK